MKTTSIRKKAAFLTAVTMLVLSLSACSGQVNTSKQSGADPASTAETVSAETSDDTNTADTAAISYDSKLFDTSYVHTIDVTISETDWADLLANPKEKTKYETSITIDGETISSVSFSTKGNTSLSFVADDQESDRYSFKVNFGKYVEGQTYYGLNKLNLNNIYADATYMKDHLSYKLFHEAGVDAPLTSYVWLTVNGEDKGLYLAIEEVGSSYLDRTQNGEGELYKPETEMLDNDGKGGMQPPQMPDGEMPQEDASGEEQQSGRSRRSGRPDRNAQQDDSQMTPPEGFDGMTPPEGFDGMTPPEGFEEMIENGEFPDMGGMGFGGSNKGASLVYTDDELTSYSDIFDNAETDADEEAQKCVVAALKGMSDDPEQYLDTNEIIRYFAAHNFVLNYDSYTGNMLHNYYLYENNGKLSMLPWDYNLAFGSMAGGMGGKDGSSDATTLINTGIDTPLSGAEESSRPMWAWISASESYLEQYHAVYNDLLTKYFESGQFEQEIDSLYEMLLPYIQKQTDGFFTADEFTTAYNTLKQFCLLRAQSIRAQLDGKLSTDTKAQDSAAQISAEGIQVSDMGSQDGKDFGGKDFGRKGFGGKGMKPGRDSDSASPETTNEATSEIEE